MVNLYNHFDLIGLLGPYRPICFYGGGANVTQHNGIIQYFVALLWTFFYKKNILPIWFCLPL